MRLLKTFFKLLFNRKCNIPKPTTQEQKIITPEQAINIFKKEYKGYNNQKITHLTRVDGFGYMINIRPTVYTGPMGVDFEGHYKMFNANLFDENDPFTKAKKESLDYLL